MKVTGPGLSWGWVATSVDLSIAEGSFTIHGCDLTDGYVRANADSTTCTAS